MNKWYKIYKRYKLKWYLSFKKINIWFEYARTIKAQNTILDLVLTQMVTYSSKNWKNIEEKQRIWEDTFGYKINLTLILIKRSIYVEKEREKWGVTTLFFRNISVINDGTGFWQAWGVLLFVTFLSGYKSQQR